MSGWARGGLRWLSCKRVRRSRAGAGDSWLVVRREEKETKSGDADSFFDEVASPRQLTGAGVLSDQ
jgi:hypothetical protein